MTNTYTNFDRYLKTFLNIELYFLASPALQQEEWASADSDDAFGTCLLLSFESWSVIVDHRKQFKLTDLQFESMKKLFSMLREFQIAYDYPTKPSEYRSLLNHPEWQKIQKYAKELYDRINPTIA